MYQEKGSMAVFVGIVLLGMLFVVMSVFLISNNSLQAQAESAIKIKEAYEADVNNVDEIYQNLTGTSTDEPGEDNEYVTSSLVLHYDAINNTGEGHSSTTTTWKDLSGNGNNGTLSTSPTTSNFYWEDNSITISGYSSGDLKYYVDTPLNLSGQERTYIYTIDANNLTGSIWGETDSSNRNGFFNYQQFISNRATSSTGENRFDYTFAKREIYNYAVSISSSQIKFYENGKLITTMNNTVGLKANNTLRLLAARYSTQNASNLKMYHFMAYNRALTEEEIQTNFIVDKAKYNIISDTPHYVTDGLVLHYDAIDNTGNGHSTTTTTWKDLSGNGNDGTLSTSPTTSNFYWEDNSITISGYSSGNLKYYVDTPLKLSGQERTYIYTIDATNLTGTIWGETNNSNLYGLINYYQFICNRGGSTSGDNRYSYTFAKSGKYSYAVSVSSSQVKFYENGQLITTINNETGLNCSNTLRLLAGRHSTQNSSNLKMYNFMAYNRALLDDEVLQNYNMDKEKYSL